MKSKLILICSFLMVSGLLMAQKTIECKIVFNVTSDLWKDQGSKQWTTYIKGNHARIEASMMENMESVVLVDGTKNEVTTLTTMGGNKMGYVFTTKDMEKYNTSKTTVTMSKETKTIAGYLCKKAEITTENGGKVDCYFTEQLGISNITALSNPVFKDIKGVLLEYKINEGGFNIHCIAKEVKKEKIDDLKFAVPKDYKIMTAEEMMKSMGSAGQ